MRRLRLFGGTIGLLMVVSVGQQVSESTLRERARAAADALPSRLLTRLNQEYQQGGAVRGVRVCAEVAQSLTRQVGREQKLRIRRVSLKNRNPCNAPNTWERQVLQRWENDLRAGKQIGEVAVWRSEGGQRVYRYMRPIMITMPLCLECHGDPQRIKPEVRRLIRQNYPNDKATGYKLGDLRGAFSITIVPKRVQQR